MKNDLRRQAEVFKKLQKIALGDDDKIPLALTGLTISKLLKPKLNLKTYQEHLKDIHTLMLGVVDQKKPDVHQMHQALVRVFVGKLGYKGDYLSYDKFENSNLSTVINNRCGLPICLGMMYLHAAQKMKWRVVGLNFPGHFLLRLEAYGQRLIIDPFNDGKILDVAALRELLKANFGPYSELEQDFYLPCSNKEIILRYLNNIKLRLIKNRKIDQAVMILEVMILFDQSNPYYWREKGLLNINESDYSQAIISLQNFIDFGNDEDKFEGDVAAARQILNQIKVL